MNSLVVKDNTLIEASYKLGLIEQRLIVLAIIQAREVDSGIDHNTLIRVHAHRYAEEFDVHKGSSYEIIKEASKGIFDRYITYHDKNPKNGNDRSFHCRWVDKIGYEEEHGTVYMRFTADVIPLITRLEKNFTSYYAKQIAKLDSGYATRLYELLIQWRKIGKTPTYELQQFRRQLGVEEKAYTRMSDFKKNVLDSSINKINEHTDIIAKYKQHKTGRKITGFTFTFKLKKQEEPSKSGNTDKPSKSSMYTIDGLSDKQLKRITRHKDFVKTYSKMTTGDAGRNWDSYSEFMIKLIKKNPLVFNEKRPIREYLNGVDDDYMYV